MSIRAYLQSRGVWFETLLHNPTPTATRMARQLHVPGRLVAKGVLLKVGPSFALAVLPATCRIDLARLRTIFMAEVRLATEAEVEQVFGDCELGALPPFGRLYGIATVVDASMAGDSEIVFVANQRHEGVRMRFRDYETLEAPILARFAEATATRQPRPSSRRAG